MNKILNSLVVLVASLALSSGAQAAGSFGLAGGWGTVMEDSLPQAKWNAGASLSYGIGSMASLGAFVDYQTTEEQPEVLGVKIKAVYMPIGLTLNFRVGGGFYLGANGGTARLTITAEGGGISSSATGSDPFAGGQLGFDLPIGSSTSIGLEGKYLHVLADEAFGIGIGQANLKFWF